VHGLLLVLRGFAEVYGSGSILPSPEESRARYEVALAGEIEAQLGELPHVVRARVIVSAAPPDPFGAPPPPSSASVVLTVDGDAPPVADVQRLVAGAATIRPEDVAVVVQVAPPPPHQPRRRSIPIVPIAGLLAVLLAGIIVIARELRRQRGNA
jgi:type III secretory pathway lipoprotein EscJ